MKNPIKIKFKIIISCNDVSMKATCLLSLAPFYIYVNLEEKGNSQNKIAEHVWKLLLRWIHLKNPMKSDSNLNFIYPWKQHFPLWAYLKNSKRSKQVWSHKDVSPEQMALMEETCGHNNGTYQTDRYILPNVNAPNTNFLPWINVRTKTYPQTQHNWFRCNTYKNMTKVTQTWNFGQGQVTSVKNG